MKCPILYLVIPCYNEEAVLPLTAPVFRNKLERLIAAEKVSKESKILFVNDGSKDSTWEIIQQLAATCNIYIGISQSRNRGHQNSLLAGLMEVKDICDISISLDCDGQDDINAIDNMVDAYLDGCDVVYAVRKHRDHDTFFKRFTAEAFYHVMLCLGAEIVFNHADYRLISAKVLKELANFKEVNLFLRGMIPLVGFKSTNVYYDRNERLAGESHYPLSKMLSFALDGITSLSIKPLRCVTFLGIFFSLLSFLGVMWVLVMHITGNTVIGWASTTSIVCFMGGIQLICLGIIGEYIGKTYMEVKARPRYIIAERTQSAKEAADEKDRG